MHIDPREALNRMIALFEAHYDAAVQGHSPDSEAVTRIETELRDAFFKYDDALFTRYEFELPFDLLDSEDEDGDDEEYEDFTDVFDVEEYESFNLKEKTDR